MKKIIKLIISCAVIIGLVYLLKNIDMLGFCATNKTAPKDVVAKYEQDDKRYYYSKLTDVQKYIYYRIDESVNKLETRITLGIAKKKDNMLENIDKAMEAYINDNPSNLNLNTLYTYNEADLIAFTLPTLGLTYSITSEQEIEQKQKTLDSAANNLIASTISSNMTDYEKELAVHDKLVEMVKYYKYEDITKIPQNKHTAYGALVEKEAVCDGIAKAFQIIMNKLGIYTITVSGEVDKVAHAWNIARLDNQYYHVDTTLDSVVNEDNKYIMHVYFNLTDQEAQKSHKISKSFELPTCDSEKFNYYKYSGRYANRNTNITSVLSRTIAKSDNLIEVMLDGYEVKEIVSALYKLNFSDYRSAGKTSIKYNNVDNIYIFIK